MDFAIIIDVIILVISTSSPYSAGILWILPVLPVLPVLPSPMPDYSLGAFLASNSCWGLNPCLERSQYSDPVVGFGRTLAPTIRDTDWSAVKGTALIVVLVLEEAFWRARGISALTNSENLEYFWYPLVSFARRQVLALSLIHTNSCY